MLVQFDEVIIIKNIKVSMASKKIIGLCDRLPTEDAKRLLLAEIFNPKAQSVKPLLLQGNKPKEKKDGLNWIDVKKGIKFDWEVEEIEGDNQLRSFAFACACTFPSLWSDRRWGSVQTCDLGQA